MRESVRLLRHSSILVLVIVKLIIGVISRPEDLPGISAAQVHEDDPNVSNLETLAVQLDLESFLKDRVLLQKLDTQAATTTYTDADGNTTYTRQGLDAGKEVVILTSSEDNRNVKIGKKRTYIVLRKVPPIAIVPVAPLVVPGAEPIAPSMIGVTVAPSTVELPVAPSVGRGMEGPLPAADILPPPVIAVSGVPVVPVAGVPGVPEGSFYYILYAYIRNARAEGNETELIVQHDRQITVEWDRFDNRAKKTSKGAFHTGWANCAYTILFSCKMNQTAVQENVGNDTLQTISQQASQDPVPPKEAETTVAVDASTIEPLEVEAGFDPDEYSDLYGDFDLVQQRSGRGFSRKYGRGLTRKQARGRKSKGRGYFGFGQRYVVQPVVEVQPVYQVVQPVVEVVQPVAEVQPSRGWWGWGGSPAPPPPPPPPAKAAYKDNLMEEDETESRSSKTSKQRQSASKGQYGPLPYAPHPDPQAQFEQKSQSSWGSFFGLTNLFGSSSTNTNTVKKQVSNANAIFGTHYVGIQGTRPIFLPDGSQTPVVFFPDITNGENVYTISGAYILGTAGYPDSFIADRGPPALKRQTPGTMTPVGMTNVGLKGGIHGVLDGETFRPDTLGVPMWFNPESLEDKKTWTPQRMVAQTNKKPRTTPNGELITYGVYFPGVSGSLNVFIPDGEGIPGFFVPNDATKPEVTAIPHGSFVATKPPGHGLFYAENTMEFATVTQVRGAFMPDGMNLTGAISGLITKDVANSFVFVVDVIGQEFAYFKSKPEAKGMWTPFLKPGEWVAPTTTPAPTTLAPTTPPPAPGAPPKKAINPSFMPGIKFPGQNSMDIFIPDNYPVEGQMLPEDENIRPIMGQMIVSKVPDTPFIFRATDQNIVSTLPDSITAMFIPDGIAPGNGIMGLLTPDSEKKNCTYESEPPGKGYWYIKSKPENLNVWTPFVPAVAPPTTKRPTIIDKLQTHPFLSGFYYPGVPGSEPIFIPEAGGVGCFVADLKVLGKSCGTYYPEKDGTPAEFVQDIPNTMKDKAPGNFVPELTNGSISVEKFHATFLQGPPSTLRLEKQSFKGWSQTEIKVSTRTTETLTSTTTVTEENAHPANTPIEVGGGFVGYPTNNKGIDALVDPNNPVFKEFLQWKSRKDKTITENEKIVIMNKLADGGVGSKGQTSSKRTSYVSLEEYKSYVVERYTIKTTKIKTDDMDEMLELAIPKAAEKYVKKKKKPIKINISVNSQSSAGAGAGAGGGGGGGTGGAAGGGGSGSGLGGKCAGGQWSTSSSAKAVAQNGSTANADAHSINGGDSKAMSLAKDGANADSAATVQNGGQANAMAQSKNNSSGSATSNALDGGIANSLAKTSKDGGKGESVANAKRTGEVNKDGCEGGGFPEEIEVDSHAAATALNNGTGGGGNVVNSIANTNVKIDMGSLLAKIDEMQRKRSEDGEDDDEDSPPFFININTNSQSNAGAGAPPSVGRSFGYRRKIGRRFGRGRGIGRSFGRGRAITAGKPSGLETRAGWKTEYQIIAPNCTFLHEDQIFYGLGSCPYTSDPDVTLASSDDPEEMVNFYLKVLRVDCIEKTKDRVMTLFSDGFLTIGTEEHEKHLLMAPDFPVQKKPKIADSDLRKLSAASELFIFSQTYFNHIKKTTEVATYIEGDGPNASRSLQFFTEFALNFVKQVRETSPRRFIRLTRNLLTSIRTILVKLCQDGDALSPCAECTSDIEMNKKDKVRAMALLQFIIHGLPPLEKNPQKEIKVAFTEFLTLNLAKLETRVKQYEAEYKEMFNPEESMQATGRKISGRRFGRKFGRKFPAGRRTPGGRKFPSGRHVSTQIEKPSKSSYKPVGRHFKKGSKKHSKKSRKSQRGSKKSSRQKYEDNY